MARKRSKSFNNPGFSPSPIAREGETTGRFIIILKGDADFTIVKSMMTNIGIRHLASASDYPESAFSAFDLAHVASAYFPKLGIIVLTCDREQLSLLVQSSSKRESPILAIEPEYVAYALGVQSQSQIEYLRGYRDAVNNIYEGLVGSDSELALAGYQDNPQYTWGLQATLVSTSRFSGRGVSLAVLDTGFDLAHPDFTERSIASYSFVPGQTVQDGNGHGTHCVGTACGPQSPQGVRRYGIAYAADIFVGKVLSDQGSGSTGSVVSGIEWALSQKCKIVSMSLAANTDQKIQQYEVPIRRALEAGTLVIAAAGNNAMRSSGNFGFVCPPANADAAMAVAALDNQLTVANFSARSSTVTGLGGMVNIAGPGVDVFSSWPMGTRYRSISGTSMATPHVAGIAALWAQANGATGDALWTTLVQKALPLNAPSSDVGTGMIQAPQ